MMQVIMTKNPATAVMMVHTLLTERSTANEASFVDPAVSRWADANELRLRARLKVQPNDIEMNARDMNSTRRTIAGAICRR
jgi:hypothetical protein